MAGLAAATVLVVGLDATVGLPGGILHGRLLDGGTSAAPEPSARPATAPEPAASVLVPTASSSTIDPAEVARLLEPILDDPDVGPGLGAAVVDVGTGQQVYADAATTARPPASSVKILTATAALELLGPDARLSTRVLETPVSAEGDPRGIPEVVLVGGGDPSLRTTPGGGDPSLRSLAAATAAALGKAGLHRVRLAYDDSLFAGPSSSPAWPDGYVESGVVGLVSALSVDAGRGADPSRSAAEVFATELRRAGVGVSGRLRQVPTDEDFAQLAEVRSQPVRVLLERMLTASDNDYAEAFGHLAAVAGHQPATFRGAASATVEALDALGLPVDGIRLQDASGLARQDRVPARALVLALALAGSHGHPELASVLSGLPVAAFTGTLVGRFDLPSRGAGFVRAKTGTLSGIAALAGTVQDREGHVLAFAFLVDRTKLGDALGAPAVLDRAAAALADCGCS
jgi:D-alanyl-D-alanine carboxypeptidase/D-alanyl-D-alanine-endopeptidase (penicillin-binding protein 4)